ncbi:MAG: phosphate acyltransferase [Burkholderiales bacterium]|jgi:glycerol-3-phosphate acyltransferase PlsX|nr:phosphate acyltransferase [Burkholderiales bacterium]MCE3268521.1 phosphate acyltransferase [Burkholderiales bacterium]
MAVVLSVDAMGGDHGVNVTVPACIRFLKEHPDVSLILVGDRDTIYRHIGHNLSLYSDRIDVVHTTEVVAMDESPQVAMRNKKDSSMRVSINMLKLGKAGAVISAGNTGALMAIARYVLRTMDGIERPAIAKILPTVKGDVCVLDLGANLESSPEHLLQFGIMGAQLMKAVSGKTTPSIGILNIGSEDIKGHEGLKKASALLKNSGLNFYGNVEGDDINKGTVDVIVCDGFTGNVALKTIEGVAKMIAFIIRKEFNSSLPSKLMGLAAMPVLNKVKATLDHRKYNGAVLLGLNGLVIKSHGGADEIGFYYALKQAYHEINGGVITMLKDYLAKHKELLNREEPKKELLEFTDLNML